MRISNYCYIESASRCLRSHKHNCLFNILFIEMWKAFPYRDVVVPGVHVLYEIKIGTVANCKPTAAASEEKSSIWHYRLYIQSQRLQVCLFSVFFRANRKTVICKQVVLNHKHAAWQWLGRLANDRISINKAPIYCLSNKTRQSTTCTWFLVSIVSKALKLQQWMTVFKRWWNNLVSSSWLWYDLLLKNVLGP